MHSVTFGVIGDARGRQRRRLALIAVAVLALTVVVIGTVRFAEGGPGRGTRASVVTGGSNAARTLVAHAQTPQGVVEIALRRERVLGKDSLCLIEATQPGMRFVRPEICAAYPLGPSSGQGIGHTHLLLGSVFSGACSRRQFLLYAAVVLSPGLYARIVSTDLRWTSPDTVAVPRSLGIRGQLIYLVARAWQPYEIVLHNRAGKQISHVSLLQLGRGFCRA